MPAIYPQARYAAGSEISKLLLERVETAERWYTETNESYQEGTATVYELIRASNRLRDTQLAITDSLEAEIKVLKSHLERVKSICDKIQGLSKDGARGGEAIYLAYSMLNIRTQNWICSSKSKPS